MSALKVYETTRPPRRAKDGERWLSLCVLEKHDGAWRFVDGDTRFVSVLVTSDEGDARGRARTALAKQWARWFPHGPRLTPSIRRGVPFVEEAPL